MANMKYAEIPYVNKKVSRIMYGTASPDFMAGKDENERLDQMFATGVNTIDTARVYGKAEVSLGRWIAERGKRDDLVLLSKCAHPSPLGRKRVSEKEIRKDFAKSIKYLNTDYIDIYLLHRDDPNVEVNVIVETLNAMHMEGKIGAFGGSNWTHERIAQANEYAYKHNMIPFTVSSPNFGLANQVKDPWGGGCVTIAGPANEQARQWYVDNQMPVVAYSSLGHGLFSGQIKSNEIDKAKSFFGPEAMKGYGYPENFQRLARCEELAAQKGCTVPQIAMAWIFQQNLNTFAVVSTTKVSRMQENIDALQIELSPQECLYLNLQVDSL